MSKHISKSRRKTPWTDAADASALQLSIDSWNQRNYYSHHPAIEDTGEIEFLNTLSVECCKYCNSPSFIRYGKTKNGLIRYKCKNCGKTFNVLTNTIFEGHKIPISEWLDFLLDVFGYGSFNLTSSGNRNAPNTTKYWIRKVFLVLKNCQDNIVLKGDVYLDETFYKVRKSDVVIKAPGIEYRGLSRNQICIGIACDAGHVICFVEGFGKTSQAKTIEAFSSHILPGSKLIHDKEKSHNKLVELLKLKEERYDSSLLKRVKDEDNPLNPINNKCRLLKQFLNAHSGFDRIYLQDYLNLYSFLMNPPEDKHKKIEEFISRAINNPNLLRYRD